MKKILVLLSVVFIGAPLFAQSPSNMQDIREALSILIDKTEQYQTQKEQTPVIKMGKNEFQLERALKKNPTAKKCGRTTTLPLKNRLRIS